MSKIKIFGLGGLNEDGKNMYVVEVDNDVFIFDAGLKYPNDAMLGVDYIIPKFDYIGENYSRIKGIFISHSHDANMGALPDVLEKYPDINVYATKFSMEILKGELEKYNIKANNLKEIRPHSKISFDNDLVIFPIQMTHVMPEVVSYVLYTNDGAIVYATDFLFDSTMLGQYKTDIGKLAYVGKQGVLCLMSESLYADKVGYTTPKQRISEHVWNVLNKNENRIIITVFPSHIYHIQEIFDQVMKTDRKVVIMSKELQDIIKKSIELGSLEIDEKRIGDLKNLDDPNSVVLVADSKEKNFSALEKIINNYDKYITLKKTDTIFITELVNAYNEKKFAKILDDIARLDVNVYSLPKNKSLSHHASQEDLLMLLNLMNPKYYFPIKGEYRLQYMNATIAESAGFNKDNIILKLNGDVVEFDNGEMIESFEKVPVEQVLISGSSGDDIGDLVLKDREMLGNSGIVIISCTLDKDTKEIIGGPEILTRGFVYVKESQELIEKTAEIARNVILEDTKDSGKRVDYTKIKNDVRAELGNYFYQETEAKPMIITVIQEV